MKDSKKRIHPRSLWVMRIHPRYPYILSPSVPRSPTPGNPFRLTIMTSRMLHSALVKKHLHSHVRYFGASCTQERGINENSNKLIWRFVPKGANIQKNFLAFVVQIEKWMNSYPRKILEFYTLKELFDQELLTV